MAEIGWKGILAGIVLLGSAMGAVGLSLPQIATTDHIERHEERDKIAIERLAQAVQSVQQEQLQSAVESYELRQLRLEQQIKEIEAAGQNASRLREENAILDQRKRRAQQKLDKLTN